MYSADQTSQIRCFTNAPMLFPELELILDLRNELATHSACLPDAVDMCK